MVPLTRHSFKGWWKWVLFFMLVYLYVVVRNVRSIRTFGELLKSLMRWEMRDSKVSWGFIECHWVTGVLASPLSTHTDVQLAAIFSMWGQTFQLLDKGFGERVQPFTHSACMHGESLVRFPPSLCSIFWSTWAQHQSHNLHQVCVTWLAHDLEVWSHDLKAHVCACSRYLWSNAAIGKLQQVWCRGHRSCDERDVPRWSQYVHVQSCVCMGYGVASTEPTLSTFYWLNETYSFKGKIICWGGVDL